MTARSTSMLDLFLGKGGGDFAAAVATPLAKLPAAVAVGDLDRDGHPDLVAALSGSNQVGVARGGSGGFQPTAALDAAAFPLVVALDRRLDVVVAEEARDAVAVLLGR